MANDTNRPPPSAEVTDTAGPPPYEQDGIAGRSHTWPKPRAARNGAGA